MMMYYLWFGNIVCYQSQMRWWNTFGGKAVSPKRCNLQSFWRGLSMFSGGSSFVPNLMAWWNKQHIESVHQSDPILGFFFKNWPNFRVQTMRLCLNTNMRCYKKSTRGVLMGHKLNYSDMTFKQDSVFIQSCFGQFTSYRSDHLKWDDRPIFQKSSTKQSFMAF